MNANYSYRKREQAPAPLPPSGVIADAVSWLRENARDREFTRSRELIRGLLAIIANLSTRLARKDR